MKTIYVATTRGTVRDFSIFINLLATIIRRRLPGLAAIHFAWRVYLETCQVTFQDRPNIACRAISNAISTLALSVGLRCHQWRFPIDALPAHGPHRFVATPLPMSSETAISALKERLTETGLKTHVIDHILDYVLYDRFLEATPEPLAASKITLYPVPNTSFYFADDIRNVDHGFKSALLTDAKGLTPGRPRLQLGIMPRRLALFYQQDEKSNPSNYRQLRSVRHIEQWMHRVSIDIQGDNSVEVSPRLIEDIAACITFLSGKPCRIIAPASTNGVIGRFDHKLPDIRIEPHAQFGDLEGLLRKITRRRRFGISLEFCHDEIPYFSTQPRLHLAERPLTGHEAISLLPRTDREIAKLGPTAIATWKKIKHLAKEKSI